MAAFGAYAMGEIRVGVVFDIGFDLLPVTDVIANLFAPGTHGEQSGQDFEIGCDLRQFFTNAAVSEGVSLPCRRDSAGRLSVLVLICAVPGR